MAVPAKRGLWSTITLSDGTQVRVELKGDEHLHYLQATDGTCYVKNNGDNIQSAKRALMLTADNITIVYDTDASPKNLYGNGVNSIQSLKTLSEEDQAVNISNIVKNDDGTITLTIDTTTGISTIRQNSESSTMYYTLQGCCAGNDYQQLSRGLYIVNGKKVVKK